jgi:hypothetical protein
MKAESRRVTAARREVLDHEVAAYMRLPKAEREALEHELAAAFQVQVEAAVGAFRRDQPTPVKYGDALCLLLTPVAAGVLVTSPEFPGAAEVVRDVRAIGPVAARALAAFLKRERAA